MFGKNSTLGKSTDRNHTGKRRFPGMIPQGFSLVELMVVVAIIGVLSALAVPRFRTFQAKARQAEAKSNLAFLYTLQQSYFGDNDKFAEMAATGQGNCPENELGFVLKPCQNARYVYTSTSTDAAVNFTAVAVSGSGSANKILSGCTAVDSWQINEEKCLCAKNDVTKHCEAELDECTKKCGSGES